MSESDEDTRPAEDTAGPGGTTPAHGSGGSDASSGAPAPGRGAAATEAIPGEVPADDPDEEGEDRFDAG